jgi:hypothetical protein
MMQGGMHMKKELKNRWVLILARVIDHRIGRTDEEKPEIPTLTVEEALVSFALRLLIVLVNFLTCAAVVANIVHHW